MGHLQNGNSKATQTSQDQKPAELRQPKTHSIQTVTCIKNHNTAHNSKCDDDGDGFLFIVIVVVINIVIISLTLTCANLQVHAKDEMEHAAIGHEAVCCFVPQEHEGVVEQAMLDHDGDFALFYNAMADLLEQGVQAARDR
jgi:hypothetical protein